MKTILNKYIEVLEVLINDHHEKGLISDLEQAKKIKQSNSGTTTVREWIDAGDRLPGTNKEVLVWMVTKIYTGVNLMCLTKAGKWEDVDYDIYSFKTVTHWMPLPNKPTA